MSETKPKHTIATAEELPDWRRWKPFREKRGLCFEQASQSIPESVNAINDILKCAAEARAKDPNARLIAAPETEETRKVRMTTQAGDCLVQLSNGRRYGSQLSTILRLFCEAKKDFPELRHEEVDIHFYGPPRLKGIMFIEFRAKLKAVPDSYHEEPGECILA